MGGQSQGARRIDSAVVSPFQLLSQSAWYIVTSPSRPRRSFFGQAQSWRARIARKRRPPPCTSHRTSRVPAWLSLPSAGLHHCFAEDRKTLQQLRAMQKIQLFLGACSTRPGRLRRGPPRPSHLVIAPATMQHPRQWPLFISVSLSQPNSRYQPHPTLPRPEHERCQARIRSSLLE